MAAGTNGAERWRILRRLILPAAVSALIVWLLVRGLSWRSVAESVLSASPAGLALYALIGLFTLWLRALRFRLLLPQPRPAAAPVFAATLIQNALGDLVPAKLASFGSYLWFMKRRLNVAVDAAASTFIVSFVLDLVTLGPLLLLAVAARFGSAGRGGPMSLSLGWVALFALILLLASAALAWWLAPLTRLGARLPRALARGRETGLWLRAAGFLERTAAAMAAARGQGGLPRLLAVSLAIRLAKYAALFTLTEALLSGAGIDAPRPDLWDLIIGVSATELVATLPIPALGQFGVWEGGMIGVLLLMGFDRQPATIVAFGLHSITTAYEYILAFLALAAVWLLARMAARSRRRSAAGGAS